MSTVVSWCKSNIEDLFLFMAALSLLLNKVSLIAITAQSNFQNAFIPHLIGLLISCAIVPCLYGWIQTSLLQLVYVVFLSWVYCSSSWEQCLLVIGFVTTGLWAWSQRGDCGLCFERERLRETSLIEKYYGYWHTMVLNKIPTIIFFKQSISIHIYIHK